MTAEKDAVTDGLRQLILEKIDFIAETDRADEMLINLSFQSRVKPERHVWIDTQPGIDEDAYSVDLEDWTYEGTWDNAVATVDTTEPSVVSDVVRTWLRGSSLEEALMLAENSTVERK
jgi:hypothetical protein